MPERLAPYLHVYLLELKGAFAYRVDFWVRSVGGPLLNALISYFLWSSMLSNNNTLAGYTLDQLTLYTIVVSTILLGIRGTEMGMISTEIYEGGLTKFLVYPLSFLGYKLAGSLARVTIYLIQIILVIAIYKLFFNQLYPTSRLILAIPTILLASITYFLIWASLELCAFWVDNTWSLVVMLQFLSQFFGGALIPLDLFPSYASSIFPFLPFGAMVWFPTRVLTTQVTISDFVINISSLLLWTAFFLWLSKFVWRKGINNYSGVGQ